MLHKRLKRPFLIATTALLALGMLGLPTAGAAADQPVRFAIQNWPGVTVKTEVARDILDAMGYDSELQKLGPQFIYEGIRSGDVDVSLGAWMPAHKNMVQPLLDDDVATKYAVNLEGAIQGLAIPEYTYNEGIQTVRDMIENGDRFDHKIYAIGAGAAMTTAFQKAVENDYMGLGDWEVVPSSTSGMLSQIERRVGDHKAVVFHGWRPHWMNVKYDLRFLKADPKNRIASIKSSVYTVVAKDWPGKNPQVAKFLEQFRVPVKAQNHWIDGLNRQGKKADAVAEQWIADNMDTVEEWVQGVKTADGDSGLEAVQSEFGE